MPPRLLLVDGHYYLYRSFFAIRGLSNSRGEPTNAIFAFTKALRKMLADLQPTHGAVFWDAGLPAHRVALQPAYKSQRPPMPEDLQAQEQAVMDLCPLLGLPSLSVPGVEADDLMAGYALAACDAVGSASETAVFLATADKDILQVVRQGISVYSTAKADLALVGESPSPGFALLGTDEVIKKWGVPPERIVDVLSLTGDSADNIPGVPGVGEKTAAALVQAHGSVAELLTDLSRVTNPKLREKLATHTDQIQSNYEMVRLQTDLPTPPDWEALALRPQPAALLEFLRQCEFRSLVRELEAELAQPPTSTTTQTPTPLSQGELF